MLSRPATKISLTGEDITAYEQRKAVRDAMKAQEMDSSQETTQDLSENGASPPASVNENAGKTKLTREQRLGLGASSGRG